MKNMASAWQRIQTPAEGEGEIAARADLSKVKQQQQPEQFHEVQLHIVAAAHTRV